MTPTSEICRDCGGNMAFDECLNPSDGPDFSYIWRAPDELWHEVTGWQNWGILCIPCFNRRAQDQGKLLYWQCSEGDWE